MSAGASTGAAAVIAYMSDLLGDLGLLYAIPLAIAAFGAALGMFVSIVKRAG